MPPRLTLKCGVQNHLEQILPSVLHGLADETDGVRGAALAAGRTMVELYADSALPLLLPAVEEGIINDNWRIRQSSAELMGDLLFKVCWPYSSGHRLDISADMLASSLPLLHAIGRHHQ